MAEKKKKSSSSSSSSKTVTKTTNTWSSTKILDCIAYFAIMFIAIALLLQAIFKSVNANVSVANAFEDIGQCVAYIVAIWLGFYWTRRKRNIWWLICWIVATVVIVVLYILNITL